MSSTDNGLNGKKFQYIYNFLYHLSTLLFNLYIYFKFKFFLYRLKKSVNSYVFNSVLDVFLSCLFRLTTALWYYQKAVPNSKSSVFRL